MLRLERHPLGWTVGLTFAVCLLLSVLPLPDAARPFPKLLKTPKQAFIDVFLPGDGAPPVQPPEPELDDVEVAVGEGNEFPEMDLSGAESTPLPPAHLKETRQLERLAQKVGAVQTEVEQPCLAPNPGGCRRLALAPMFEAAKAHGAPVRAVVLGTSLIASDHITDVLRRRLQTRHGDGGLGFMFVDRPTRGAGRTVRSGDATPGWGIAKVTDEAWPKNAGLPGVMFQARGDAPQRTRFKPPPGTRRLELYLMGQPGGGVVQVLADGVQVGQAQTRADAPTPLFPVVSLPPDVKELVLATKDGPVRLDGVVLETGGPGFVLDSLGLPGSTATVLLRDDEALFTAQLKVRAPQLVIFMIGGNEAFDISLNRYTPQDARERMQQLIRRVKGAVPGAACLLASPPDGGLWRMDQTVAVREQTKVVAAFMRKLAVQERCAYYDMQEAMGGEGSVERWWKAA